MSDGTVYNLLRNSDLTRNVLTAVTTAATGKAATYRVANWGNASKPTSDSSGLHFTGPTNDSSPNAGVGVEFAASDLGLVNGDTYVLSVEVASLAAADANNGLAVWQYASGDGRWWTGKATRSKWSSGAGVYHTSFAYDGSAYVYLLMSVGQSGSATVTRIGLYHAASAAWAPAEGETLVGVGALMSANLWDASAANFKPDADGVYLAGKSTGELQSAITGASALAENQTIHMGASLRGADKGCLKPFVGYKDAAGNTNCVGFPSWQPTNTWQRFEDTCVVPSGMTVCGVGFDASGATGDIEVSNPVFCYGSPVTLASDAHTPYATQDHVAAEYATKAALKVTSDAVTAEVTERGKLAGRVGTLESTFADPAASRRALGIATVADVAWTDLWKDTNGHYVRWACRNNVVYVTWKIPQASTPQWKAGILPAGYRPSEGTVAVAAWTEGNRMATGWVDVYGDVFFKVNSAQTNGTNQGSLSYPIF